MYHLTHCEVCVCSLYHPYRSSSLETFLNPNETSNSKGTVDYDFLIAHPRHETPSRVSLLWPASRERPRTGVPRSRKNVTHRLTTTGP